AAMGLRACRPLLACSPTEAKSFYGRICRSLSSANVGTKEITNANGKTLLPLLYRLRLGAGAEPLGNENHYRNRAVRFGSSEQQFDGRHRPERHLERDAHPNLADRR